MLCHNTERASQCIVEVHALHSTAAMNESLTFLTNL